MRHSAPSTPLPVDAPRSERTDGETLRRLLPYLWTYKWRVLVALGFMVAAKLANVGVPVLLKHLVDAMNLKPGEPATVLVVPAALLLVYGLLRLSVSAFTELRELVFAKAIQGAARRMALETFRAEIMFLRWSAASSTRRWLHTARPARPSGASRTAQRRNE